MKLRIQDDSLRLRLTQAEVAQLGGGNPVERVIHFPVHSLTYAIAVSAGAKALSVTYIGDAVRVTLPLEIAKVWAESNQVGIEGQDGPVRILIEKDFQCLHQPVDRDPDAFPNPSAA